MTFEELARAPSSELQRLLACSPPPPLEALVGLEFRGWNTPAYCAPLGIRKFIKAFFGGPDGVEGCNIPVRQNRLDEPWLHKPSAEAPKRFGFYKVTREGGRLLLDYGASPRNARLAPERLLRDALVMPDPARPYLLLGRAWLALGARVPVSWFVLERLRASAWRPQP